MFNASSNELEFIGWVELLLLMRAGRVTVSTAAQSSADVDHVEFGSRCTYSGSEDGTSDNLM